MCLYSLVSSKVASSRYIHTDQVNSIPCVSLSDRIIGIDPFVAGFCGIIIAFVESIIPSNKIGFSGGVKYHPNIELPSRNKIIKTNNFSLEQIIVVHDDLDLPIGSLKLKIGGGHGGHNGLRSIISHSGKSFIRLRVGIGHPGNKVDVTNWVLGKFKPVEKDSILESFYRFNTIIELLGNNDIQNAQLKLHTE